MAVTIGKNLSSIKAQRQLALTSDSLAKTNERLASGMRINRASDDAASLSIAESLRSNSRVYTQAIRNSNDAVSLLNIAEGAIAALSTIITRGLELAEQSANGVYSNRQRIALHNELNSLRKEYNRITSSTTFNGISLFNGSREDIRIQLGYGLDGSLLLSPRSGLVRNVGSGVVASTTTTSVTAHSGPGLASGDINGDGLDDLVIKDGGGNHYIRVAISRGDGTFSSPQDVGLVANVPDLELIDVNSDGNLDIVTQDVLAAGGIYVALGTGNGTFSGFASYAKSPGRFSPNVLAFGDFNNDGNVDIAGTVTNGNAFSINFGRGDGTFTSAQEYGSSTFVAGIASGDLNSDGNSDIVVSSFNGQVEIYYGSGSGSFSNPKYLSDLDLPGYGGMQIADIDDDGDMDIMGARGNGGGNTLHVYRNQGNGNFAAVDVYTTGGNSQEPRLFDFNGDDFLDIAVAGESDNSVHILTGKGDGTFNSSVSYSVSAAYRMVSGDFNGDGVSDLALTDDGTTTLSIMLTGIQTAATLEKYDLRSRSTSLEALEGLRIAMNRITTTVGMIGAQRSRLDVAVSNLYSSITNIDASLSRLIDADVSSESANAVKLSILQQVGAAILSQANQEPALALRLLT